MSLNREQRRQEKWILENIELHKEFVSSEKDDSPPIWLVIRTSNFEKSLGKSTTVPCLIADCGDESPNKIAKGLIDKYDPDVWVYFAEGWAKIFNDNKEFEDFSKTRKRGDIKHLPDKLEGLNIVGKNRDGSVEITEQYWIIRDKDNKIIDFKPSFVGTEHFLQTSYLNENPKSLTNVRHGEKN